MNKKGIKPSICFICLGLILIVAGLCSWFLVFGKDKSNTEKKETSTNTEKKSDVGPADHDGTRVLKNGRVTGYSLFNNEGILYVETDNGEEVELRFKEDELLEALNDYEDYIRVNITYTESGKDKFLGDYELINYKTGDQITGVHTEAELRTRLGLYNVGTYTEVFTLKTPLDNQGIGINDEGTFTFYELTFEKENGEEFRISLQIPEGDPRDYTFLQVGNKYNVTFEVTYDSFDYDIILKDATPIE